MRTTVLCVIFPALVACNKPEPSPSAGANTANAASTAAADGPTAKAAAAPKTPFVQKGIKSGKVVVGYLQDNSDESQCAAVTEDPAKKDGFAKNADKPTAPASLPQRRRDFPSILSIALPSLATYSASA